MDLFKIFIVCLMGLSFGALHAQERAAGSALDVQMSWSALSTMVNAVDTKTTAVNSRVDQLVVCSKKGMVYAPGATGVDAQGCLNPKNTVDTTLYDKMVACGDQGLVYDKSANGCVSTSANHWSFMKIVPYNGSHNLKMPDSIHKDYGPKCTSAMVNGGKCATSDVGKTCLDTSDGNKVCSGGDGNSGACNAQYSGYTQIYKCL